MSHFISKVNDFAVSNLQCQQKNQIPFAERARKTSTFRKLWVIINEQYLI